MLVDGCGAVSVAYLLLFFVKIEIKVLIATCGACLVESYGREGSAVGYPSSRYRCL
jgi:hypothetical protein